MRHKTEVNLLLEVEKLVQALKVNDVNEMYTVSGRIQRATRETIAKTQVQVMVPSVVVVSEPTPEAIAV